MTATTSPADRLRMLAGELLQREQWSRDQLLSYQHERLRELMTHAMSASEYYREALDGGDLAAQPTLSKQTLMEQWDRIVCDPRLRRGDVAAHAASPQADTLYLGEYEVFSTRA